MVCTSAARSGVQNLLKSLANELAPDIRVNSILLGIVVSGQWRRRFEEAWPKIEKLGFDNRFRRLWRYYLTYCEAGFEEGVIDVGLYRLRRA